MVQIERSNVQGLIFQSFNYPLVGHFFFQFPDGAAAREFLKEWVPHVTSAAVDIKAKPEPLLNIALSWQGIQKTGAVDDRAGAMPATRAFRSDFRDPPNPKAMRDSGDSAPANWWKGQFVSEDVDVAMFCYCQSAATLAEQTTAIRASADRLGVKELVPSSDGEPLTGRLAPKGILHFGYRDGISQPQVNWEDAPGRPDLVDLRRFVLGYGEDPNKPIPNREPWTGLVRDGSYLVLRWIYQDVAKFNKFLRERSKALWPNMPADEAQELLAAKMMGRWRNGTPLVLFPDAPEPKPEDFMRNDFDYTMDPDGERCPFSSHIRIANRRDDALNERNKSMFPSGTPRVLRRGSSYGTTLEGENDDGLDRGLIGLFLCTDIESQFFALMRWINETNFHAKVDNQHGQDPLFGNRTTPDRSDEFEFQAKGEKHVLTGLQDFIRTQGVLNLLLPSVSALKQMATPNA
jgi:deferrochelatase/peroxidase EfeB